MTVGKLQRYLDELLSEDRRFDPEVVAAFKSKAKDWLGVSEDVLKFLAETVLREHADRFATEADRQNLGLFLFQQVQSRHYPWEPFLKLFNSIPGLSNCLIEAHLGQLWQIFKDGNATSEDIQKVRQNSAAPEFRGTASLAKIHPKCVDMATIEAALSKAIYAIDGFGFLSGPPQGKDGNEHTILIKPGVNWGGFGYPTVTSWESVYALTKMCFQEAGKQQASVKIIVADESGIIYDSFDINTKENLEHTGILGAAILAGLEQAAFLEQSQPGGYHGASELLALANAGYKVSFCPKDDNSVRMIEMAQRAGVQVEAFDHMERQRIPFAEARHFTAGIPLPQMVVEEVTDIINLPKPPGRHLIMGNTAFQGP
jgi:hypothetical protein